MDIELDKPGKYPPHDPPHWLKDKGRAWLRWWRHQCESAAFYRKHGPVVKTEPNNRKEG
jgi:uncharacterized membrane-anchored protein